MELNELEKQIAISILKKADGEDVSEIIKEAGFEDYLFHYLFMGASWDTVAYETEEKKQFDKVV